MKYFSRLGFILLAICLFQSHNAFAVPLPFSISGQPFPANPSDFSLNSSTHYTATQIDQTIQDFRHFETIVFEEDILASGSHTVRVTVQNIPSGNSSGTTIAINKRIANPNNLDWDSILIEVSGVGGANGQSPIPSNLLADPTVGANSADALYLGGNTSSNTGTLDIFGPGFELTSQFTDDVTVDTNLNEITFENPSLYEIAYVNGSNGGTPVDYINLWFTLLLPGDLTFYQFDLIQTFNGPNSSGPGAGSTIPEPGILLLVGLGLLSAGIRRNQGLTNEKTTRTC